ncbi:hypothetical protein ONZ45_g9866 [Pleurotus djamor]|nr:hypothetical protein ONZ45_g9866 [Pleurotus djamor]
MNLRRVLGFSVVLACVLAVYAAPRRVDNSEEESFDIEARGYDDYDVALHLRAMAIARSFPESYDVVEHEKRAPPKKAAPRKKTTAKRPAVKKAPKKAAPKKSKPKSVAKKPAKKPAPKKSAPKKGPARKPPPKKPGKKPAKTPAKKPGKTPAKKPGKTPEKKPTGGSCPLRTKGGKGKRAFETGCDDASLTLGGVTRSITKVGQQGNSAITYKVSGAGWPDPSTGKDVTAYAKTGKSTTETFASEIKWLKKTDQLLAEGKFEGRQFIVFHGVTGKKDITGTNYWRKLAEDHMMKGDVAGCEAEVKKTLIPLIIREAKVYVDKFQVLHTDIQPGNILWDAAGTDPTLIDWGRAEEVASWSADVEKRVRAQAEFSHLKGDEKICHNLKG